MLYSSGPFPYQSSDQSLLGVVFKLVQRPEHSIALEKNEALEPPWQPDMYLIGCVLACGDTENVVELFESALPRKNVSGGGLNREREN